MPYCEHCGTYLEEGQHCTCQASQNHSPDPDFVPVQDSQPGAEAPPQGETSQPQNHQAPGPDGQQGSAPSGPPHPPGPTRDSKFAIAVKNLLPYLKAYWRSPAQATQSAVEQRDWLLAVLLCAAQALAAILACASILLHLNQLLGLLFSIPSYFGVGVEISPALAIPYGLLATVLGAGLMMVMLFVLAKLTKSKASFLDVFIACGANTIPVTILLLLAFLLGLISLSLGLGLLVMVIPVSAATGLISVRSLSPDRENGLFWTIYLVGMMLVFLLAWMLFSSILF